MKTRQILVLFVAPVVLLAGLAAFLLTRHHDPSFDDIAVACRPAGTDGIVTVTDSGHTLAVQGVDGAGSDIAALTSAAALCVLGRLDAPGSIVAKISQTTALAGEVSDTWKNYAATWTYHPDRGIGIVIVKK